MISHLTSDEGKADLKALGGVSAQTAGVILRALVNLEAEGADTFFGEPELDPNDLLRFDDNGHGVGSRCSNWATKPHVRCCSPLS